MTLAIDWGPVAAWAGAVATVGIMTVTALVALGVLSSVRRPHLRLTFEPTEPWTRQCHESYNEGFWVRMGVENPGSERTGPARGCVGRLIRVTTNGELRPDVDPVQLRWAGVPLSRAFDPVDLRHGQREFLDVARLREGAPWRIVTFEDPDFLRGFTVDLERDAEHVFTIAVFSDNAPTVTCDIAVTATAEGVSVGLAVS